MPEYPMGADESRSSQPDTGADNVARSDPSTGRDEGSDRSVDQPSAGREAPGVQDVSETDPAIRHSRLARFLRPSRTQVILALALALVGVATVTQIRSVATVDRYDQMSRTELIQLLDGLNAENQRLSADLAGLESTRNQLQSGADAAKVAQDDARRRLDSLAILAGTKAAQGPGIQLVVNAPAGRLTADLLLEGIEELRDAGAETMQINESIRVVASTWVADSRDGLQVDGQTVGLPMRIDVIGDPDALEKGAAFRGGFVSQVESEQVGGTVAITRLQEVRIDALRQPTPLQYAKPA